ncbi:MAG: hypothetical protein M3211_12385 [Actinomycetota bacterium]|nr:hypothetical protein [Actinomycetota bacterium]
MSRACPTPARRALPSVLLLVTTSGCFSTPDAADLVAEHERSGGRVREADAVAALVDYVGVVNQALRTGDTEALATMTAAGCPCRELVAFIDDSYADDAELIGAFFDVGELSVQGLSGRRARVRAGVSVSAYDVRNRDGLVVGSEPAQRYVAVYTLRRRDDGAWRVVDVRETER